MKWIDTSATSSWNFRYDLQDHRISIDRLGNKIVLVSQDRLAWDLFAGFTVHERITAATAEAWFHDPALLVMELVL